jgi:hypothetical protein
MKLIFFQSLAIYGQLDLTDDGADCFLTIELFAIFRQVRNIARPQFYNKSKSPNRLEITIKIFFAALKIFFVKYNYNFNK